MKRAIQATEPDFLVIPNLPLSEMERQKLSAIIAKSRKDNLRNKKISEQATA